MVPGIHGAIVIARPIRGVLTFEPDGDGTRRRWLSDLQPNGALKVLSPIIVRIGRRQEAANWASLERYLESIPPAGTEIDISVEPARDGAGPATSGCAPSVRVAHSGGA